MDALPPRANSFTLPASSPTEDMMLACRALMLFMMAATPSGNIGCDAAQLIKQNRNEIRTLNIMTDGALANRQKPAEIKWRCAAAQRHAWFSRMHSASEEICMQKGAHTL